MMDATAVGTGANTTDVTDRARPALSLPARLLATLLTAAVLTFLAPWGTDRLPLLHRAAAWLAMVAVWEVCIAAMLPAAIAWRRHRGAEQPRCLPTAWILAVVLAASIPAIPVCLLGMFGHIPSLSLCATFAANSIGLGILISLLRSQMLRRHRAFATVEQMRPSTPAPMAVTPPDRDGPPAFLMRHAPRLAGARLLALEAEDHYLRIHTDAGHELVLQRLRDAIDSLGEGIGLQVHRSFWVAKDAAPQARRRGQAWQLDLANGLSVPVSKANIPACRAAGWF